MAMSSRQYCGDDLLRRRIPSTEFLLHRLANCKHLELLVGPTILRRIEVFWTRNRQLLSLTLQTMRRNTTVDNEPPEVRLLFVSPRFRIQIVFAAKGPGQPDLLGAPLDIGFSAFDQKTQEKIENTQIAQILLQTIGDTKGFGWAPPESDVPLLTRHECGNPILYFKLGICRVQDKRFYERMLVDGRDFARDYLAKHREMVELNVDIVQKKADLAIQQQRHAQLKREQEIERENLVRAKAAYKESAERFEKAEEEYKLRLDLVALQKKLNVEANAPGQSDAERDAAQRILAVLRQPSLCVDGKEEA